MGSHTARVSISHSGTPGAGVADGVTRRWEAVLHRCSIGVPRVAGVGAVLSSLAGPALTVYGGGASSLLFYYFCYFFITLSRPCYGISFTERA